MPEGLVPLLLLAPVLVLAGWSDLSRMRIPNAVSLIALGLFAATFLAGLVPDAPVRLAIAATAFACGFVAYCAGLFGGGDVKFLAALLLFVPADALAVFGWVFCAAMATGMLLVAALRRMPALRATGWRSMQPGRHFPMGVSIALAGLALPFVMAVSGGALFQ